ncbi:unnamed protein product, partial [Owenia fusiformis]
LLTTGIGNTMRIFRFTNPWSLICPIKTAKVPPKLAELNPLFGIETCLPSCLYQRKDTHVNSLEIIESFVTLLDSAIKMQINIKDVVKNDVQNIEVNSMEYREKPTTSVTTSTTTDRKTVTSAHSDQICGTKNQHGIVPSSRQLRPTYSDVLLGISFPKTSSDVACDTSNQALYLEKPATKCTHGARVMADSKIGYAHYSAQRFDNSNMKRSETTSGVFSSSELKRKERITGPVTPAYTTENYTSRSNTSHIFTTVMRQASVKPKMIMVTGPRNDKLLGLNRYPQSKCDRSTKLTPNPSIVPKRQPYSSRGSLPSLAMAPVSNHKMLDSNKLLSNLNENMQTRNPHACSLQSSLLHQQDNRERRQYIPGYESLLSLTALTQKIKSETEREHESIFPRIIPRVEQPMTPSENSDGLNASAQEEDNMTKIKENDVNNNHSKTIAMYEPKSSLINYAIKSRSPVCIPKSRKKIILSKITDESKLRSTQQDPGSPPNNAFQRVNLPYQPANTSESSICIESDQLDELTDAESNDDSDDNAAPYAIQTEPISSENEQSCDSNDNTPRKSQKRKIPRKPANPLKSPPKWDPSFRGVTMQIKTKLKPDGSHLSISCYFNCRKIQSKWRRHRRYSHQPQRCSQSTSGTTEWGPSDPEEYANSSKRENRLCFYYSSTTGKQCASCSARKTPLWRDAEDGTPLCNACGIRYKKYRVRCVHCWHIPKKDSKAYPDCPNCGCQLRYTLVRRFDPLLPLKSSG